MSASKVDLSPILPADPLDLRGSLTTITHLVASADYRLRIMRIIEFPVQDVAMFLVVNQLTYRGAMRPTDISKAIGTGRANVSKIVARLISLGLVQRVESPTDERSVLIALTEHGRIYGERIMALAGARLDRVLRMWSPQEISTLQRLIARLARDMGLDDHSLELEERSMGAAAVRRALTEQHTEVRPDA